MGESMVKQVARLQTMTVGALRERYAEVFGDEPRSRNKDYLWKRIAFRLHELSEGGISDRVKKRAEELARDTDLRVKPPKDFLPLPDEKLKRDPRLPEPGSTLKREYNGKEHEVLVLEDGFEYGGRRFSSLSAVAREIAGTRWNGFLFFQIADSAGGRR